MKKILSIDGGGIRGLIPALVLAEIEKKTGKPISKCFDLIAGTSTGGILALGLSKPDENGLPEFSAKDLSHIYKNRGKEIFNRSFWQGVSSVGGLAEERYSHEGIEKVLQEYFSDEPISSALTDVLIPTYDIYNRTPLFIKSWRDEHRTALMKHVARATSAAPTYFEPALIPIGGSRRALVDGGVFINSPSVSAYAEAKVLYPEEDHILVVSLGTGELNRPIEYNDAKGWGKVSWVSPLINCIFDGVADAADYQLNQFLGDNYIRFQINLDTGSDDMDDASNGNIKNLETEAKKLLRIYKDTINNLCELIAD